MTFHKIEPEKLANSVSRQIEDMILRGILRPGERLPSERDLSEKLGVSRPSLREALADLQARGLLVSRAGAGVFVAEVLGSAFSPALVQLMAAHDSAALDYLSFRRDLESIAAERAAQAGSDADLAVINAVYHRMEAAHAKRDPSDEAQIDAEFHMAIIESSHNIVMLHMMRSMFDLLRQGVFYNRQAMFRQKTNRDTLLYQHKKINDALQERDSIGARHAVEEHLNFVERSLVEIRRADANVAIAEQKLEQELERARKYR